VVLPKKKVDGVGKNIRPLQGLQEAKASFQDTTASPLKHSRSGVPDQLGVLTQPPLLILLQAIKV